MDLVGRAIVGFLALLLITRVAGRRELSTFEPFDLILLVVIGDLLQQGITQDDYSVTGMLLVLLTVTLMSVGVSYVSYRFGSLRGVLEGEPIVLIDDGTLLDHNLRRERLTPGEIAAAARQNGIFSLTEVRWAVLETNGQISFLERKDGGGS
jgi:uncharacterized membrane protein YcaP (DUF421 family)